MVNMLVTINISKGWDTWSKMAKGLEPQMNEVGSKVLNSMVLEQRTENPRVGGSNPPPGTIYQASRSVDRGSSDCFQTINVLEQELVFPWCG